MGTETSQTPQKKFSPIVAAIIVAVLVIGIGLIFVFVKKIHDTDIFDAAWKGHLGSVTSFVERGVDVNTTNKVGDIPLHLAKTKEVAEFLISKGSQIDKRNVFGGTPLHMAAVNGCPEVAIVLIDHGADVNALDIVGATPLDHALIGREKVREGNHNAVIALLLEKGGRAEQYSDKLKAITPKSESTETNK
jgi:ankyrin repeat protein